MIAPARALAFETIRETFERDAFTERAFRAGAERLDLDGRERAQAQRLAYGAVQRCGTTDAAIERLAGRSTRLLDPPVLAALRLGLYELLFADGTPDHAAVDQAVELVKGAGAAHASGLVNAVLRRATREREALTAALLEDDSTPEAAAVAHSAPLWLVRMWWEELGAETARSLLAACNQPAEVAMRANPVHGGREVALEKLSAAGVETAPAGGGWPLETPELLVLGGRMGETVPAMVRAGELTPQSRGSAAVVEVLDPHQGEQLLDLCAGPGIKTGQIAARMGDRGEVISVELDSGRAEEVAAQARRLDLRSVTVFETDAAKMELPPSSTGSCSTRPARTSARLPRDRTRAGANRRGRSPAWSRSRSGRCSPPPSSCAPVAPSYTPPARSPAARTRSGLRPCSPRRPRGRPRRSSWRTSAPARPASPRPWSRAACSCAPTATAPPDSSSPA